MSFTFIKSAFISGLKAKFVKVECDIGRGINYFSIIGLGDKAVEESKDRVCSALRNSGFSNPKQVNQKTTIFLSPGDLKKEGTNFDLAIALSYLIANKEIIVDKKYIDKSIFLGELSLRGDLTKLKGALLIAELCENNNIENIFLPKENVVEASLIKNINIYGADNITEIIEHLTNKKQLVKASSLDIEKIISKKDLKKNEVKIEDIKGQILAKRALLVAIAGGHNIALYGPPGTGKTMLARASTSLLPSLDYKNILEITKIHSVLGINDTQNKNLILDAPFRSPHHTSSYVSLVGGGSNLKPGEITLAHRGILFLDEFPEFEKKSIESLREPLEEGSISISRAKGTEKFPAKFILIAAMNPCPCGNRGDKYKKCVCSQNDIARYERKLSGPIVDRIDIWVNVSNVSFEEMSTKNSENDYNSENMQEKVKKARKEMSKRFEGNNFLELNRDMNSKNIEEYVLLETDVQNELNIYATKLKLSPRSYHRVIKVARTIADLEEKENIEIKHILEALQYRPKINN